MRESRHPELERSRNRRIWGEKNCKTQAQTSGWGGVLDIGKKIPEEKAFRKETEGEAAFSGGEV